MCHADDLGYLFKTKITPAIEKGSIEDVSWRRFVKLWTNFAKFGNPTPTKEEFGLFWEPVKNAEKLKTMILGKELQMETNPTGERVKFWKSILDQSPYTSSYL